MIRVATYNIHLAHGLDVVRNVGRIARVIARLDADVVALQEVSGGNGWLARRDQAAVLARSLGWQAAFGRARTRWRAAFGNATLSRLPIVFERNHDISAGGGEPRACLRTDVTTPDGTLHLFNLHLGTRMNDRLRQARRLLDEVLGDPALTGPRIVMGDFNDSTGEVRAMLACAGLEPADMRLLGRTRTYPGLWPRTHLDHICHDRTLRLEGFRLHRSMLACVASDHLPLVADLIMQISD